MWVLHVFELGSVGLLYAVCDVFVLCFLVIALGVMDLHLRWVGLLHRLYVVFLSMVCYLVCGWLFEFSWVWVYGSLCDFRVVVGCFGCGWVCGWLFWISFCCLVGSLSIEYLCLHI